ncbi:unnamed protein product, partial [Polarella glacialis]
MASPMQSLGLELPKPVAKASQRRGRVGLRRAVQLTAAVVLGASCFAERRPTFAGSWRSSQARSPQLVALAAGSEGLDLDELGLMLPPSASGLPPLSRYKGTGFNQEACDFTCQALAGSVAKGNQNHFDGLNLALRLMMPAASGAEKALGTPRDDFILRPEILPWSEIPFLGGLEENMRLVQECEADFARMMAKEPHGFRSPVILAASMDLAVVYLKNYALDKADALYTHMEPFCLSR